MNNTLNIRIQEQVRKLERDVYTGKWIKDVEKFDKEQEIKAVNKAIKDRRGIT